MTETFPTLDIDWGEPQDQVQKQAEPARPHRRSVMCYELSEKYVYRRAFSEAQLLDALGIGPFENGHSYHFITGGDVDSLSYLKLIMLHQNIDYCLLSTWCMSAEDIKQLEMWVDAGRIHNLDIYVGEIFKSSYPVEFQMLKQMYDSRPQMGRFAIFRNHSKIYAGWGGEFPFVIESSANVNTNPRTEQGVITIDYGLAHFYKVFFDQIKSFE